MKAPKYDRQRPPGPGPEVAQDRTHAAIQPAHVSEPTPPLLRHFGNAYVQALESQKQGPGFQTDVEINEPGDRYEGEADRAADQVLRAPADPLPSGAPLPIQRLPVQTHGQAHTAPDSVGQVLASPGRPLDAALRRKMERRFGHDFSGVRVHTGAAAEQSAEDIDAQAFTVGHHIVLGGGSLGAETHEGRRVLAHELAHVIQQSAAHGNTNQQNGGGSGSSVPSSSLLGAAGTAIQRKPKRPRSGAPSQPLAKSKPSSQTGATKISFLIHFDKPLTRSEFIDLAEMTIYGRRTPGEWKGVPARFKASDSPVTVWVPASAVEPELRGRIAALPAHIQKFLLAYQGAAESHEELQSLVDAGFLLDVAGVTEDELELSLLEPRKSAPSDLVSWAEQFLVRRQEQEESERKHEERERRREAEEKELEKWRKRFEKYPDALLDKKIAELRAESGSASARDWLPRYEKERARRRDVRRARPVTRPETVDQAVSMLDEAWRDAEKEDVPDVKRALELVSRIDEWLQETASSDKYDKYFEGLYRTVARQTVGPVKEQIRGIRARLQRQGEDDWNRRAHLGGHWELGVNGLKYAREHLDVMGARKRIQETSLHGLQETTSRILKYEAAGYAIVVAAPVVIGAGIKAAPFLTTHALTGAGLRVAPRLMLWASRNPILATEIGTAVVGTVIQVGEDKYLDPLQLIFSLLHIRMAMPGRGTPAPNAPHPQGEPDFIITGQPKVDQQTGKVTASVVEKASGRHLDAEVDVTTGIGRITDCKTGQVVGNIDLNTADIGKQAPAPAPAAPALAAPAPAAPPQASIAPAAPLPAGEKGGQGTGTARGMLRNVDVPGPGVQLPASHAVFKNKPPVNDAPPVPQAQAASGVVNAPADIPGAQIIGVPQPPPAPAHKNVAPVSMATKPPPFNPPGDTGASPGPTAQPTSSPAGASESGTSPVHPHVIRRAPRAQPPPQPEAAPPAPPPQVHPNVIRRTPPAEPPPVAEVVSPAPPRAANQNVIPRPPAEPAPPAPEVAPPAPPRQVNRNVIPRGPAEVAPPPPEAAPPPAPTGSRPPGLPDDFEDAPTLVSPLQPANPDYEPSRSLVRRSGRDTDQNLRSVTGEITAPPPGPEAAPTAGPGSARLPTVETAEPQSHSPQPPVREAAVSPEPSAPARVGNTPQTPERFDFKSLPVPEQYRDAKDKVHVFGTQVIEWGPGPADAQALTTRLQTNPDAARTYIETLRGRGVTREMARAWADFYRYEHERAKKVARMYRMRINETPERRVTLMDLIASLLE